MGNRRQPLGAGTDAEQLPEASASAGLTQEPAEPCQFSPPEAVVYLNELIYINKYVFDYFILERRLEVLCSLTCT